MAVWVPVGDGFVEADVIRWKEQVFRERRDGKPVHVGERQVTAEVLEADREGWVDLLVRASEALLPRPGWALSDIILPPKDTETSRRRETIARGQAERLAWSDESARALVASQFLNEQPTAPPVAAARQTPHHPSGAEHLSSPGKRNRRTRNSGWKPPRPRF